MGKSRKSVVYQIDSESGEVIASFLAYSQHIEFEEGRKAFRMMTTWNFSGLSKLCERIHFDRYSRGLSWNEIAGLKDLGMAMRQLPSEPEAIVWQEAMALLKESEGKFEDAIRHRLIECSLIERLHRSLVAGPFDAETVEIMLHRRGIEDLEQRRSIVDLLRLR